MADKGKYTSQGIAQVFTMRKKKIQIFLEKKRTLPLSVSPIAYKSSVFFFKENVSTRLEKSVEMICRQSKCKLIHSVVMESTSFNDDSLLSFILCNQ